VWGELSYLDTFGNRVTAQLQAVNANNYGPFVRNGVRVGQGWGLSPRGYSETMQEGDRA
jgi:hypothetical protein